MTACPLCSKSFKSLRLHIAKAHEFVKVVVKPDADPSAMAHIEAYYNTIKLERGPEYDNGATGYSMAFFYPDSLAAHMPHTGVWLDVTPDHKISRALYCRAGKPEKDEAETMTIGAIAAHRLVVEYETPPTPVPAPAPVPVVIAPVPAPVPVLSEREIARRNLVDALMAEIAAIEKNLPLIEDAKEKASFLRCLKSANARLREITGKK